MADIFYANFLTPKFLHSFTPIFLHRNFAFFYAEIFAFLHHNYSIFYTEIFEFFEFSKKIGVKNLKMLTDFQKIRNRVREMCD